MSGLDHGLPSLAAGVAFQQTLGDVPLLAVARVDRVELRLIELACGELVSQPRHLFAQLDQGIFGAL